MKIVGEDDFSAWKLRTFHMFDVFRLIFSLTFSRYTFHQSFVENFMAHLLEKQSSLRVEKKKSYSQNTEGNIYSGPPDKSILL